MTDSLTIALAQLDPTVGDVTGNARRLAEARAEAARAGADLVVAPDVTDVFGTYISPTYTPGEKARYFAEPPTQLTYLGNEKLLVLYFPARAVMKTPVVSHQTEYLKLIVQSHETDFGRSELRWEFKKPKSKTRPPKD